MTRNTGGTHACYFTVIPLLFHCYFTVISLLFHCYTSVISLLYLCYFTVIPMLFHCYFTVIPCYSLLFPVIPCYFICYTSVIPLLFHCYFTMISLLFDSPSPHPPPAYNFDCLSFVCVEVLRVVFFQLWATPTDTTYSAHHVFTVCSSVYSALISYHIAVQPTAHICSAFGALVEY